MRRQIIFTLSDNSIFKVFSIAIKNSNLRINVKHIKNKLVSFADSFDVNIDNLEEADIIDRIKNISISSLSKICSHKVLFIDSDIPINIEEVNASIFGNSRSEMKNTGIQRSNENLPEIHQKNQPAVEIVDVTQRAIDKPSSQINFGDLSKSVMQILDNSRNFTVQTSEKDPGSEDRFQVFHRLLGLYGGLVTDIAAADKSSNNRNIPVSHIFFRMSHDILDPEKKNLKEFKRKIDELVSLMRQKKLEQAKEIAFIKTQTRSGLVPFYLFQNLNTQSSVKTENETVTETAIGPDSLVTRAVLQEGYDQENAPFELGENNIGYEWIDANIFNLRKEFIAVETSYQNLPDGDVARNNLGPTFVEISKSSTERVERAFSRNRESRRSLVQRRLLREIENVLLEGGSGIGVGLKYVACAFGIMLDDSIVKYQCSECVHFSSGCLKGYTDNGEPKQATSFCGTKETPAGGNSPQGIEYTMNDEISDRIIEETKRALSRA